MERLILEVIRKLLTFDQESCFESVRKQMLKRVRKDMHSNRLMSLEEYTTYAMDLTTFYFTNHHIPRMFYTIEFVEEKYPELVERIRIMVEEALKATRGL